MRELGLLIVMSLLGA